MKRRVAASVREFIAGPAANVARRLSSRRILRPGVTVVVVNFNTLPYLKVCLSAIRANSLNGTEIIVVDNASRDGSREWLKTQHDIRVLWVPVNIKHGPAMDLGIFACRTEYFVALDVDAFPIQPDWLEQLLGPLVSGSAIVSGAGYPPSGTDATEGYVHACCLAMRTDHFVRQRHTFRPGPTWDTAQSISQREWPNVHLVPITSTRGPGPLGTVFGGFVYHNFYSARFSTTTRDRLDGLIERREPENAWREAMERYFPGSVFTDESFSVRMDTRRRRRNGRDLWRASYVVRRVRALDARLRQGNARTASSNRIRSHLGRPRRLLPHAYANYSNPSVRRIGRLLAAVPNSRRYLEIGLYAGKTLEAVECAYRVGVDPAPKFDLGVLPVGVSVHETTSDRFFAELAPDETFDVVFVDGLHTYEQTYRDIVNSFAHLQPKGVLLVDDVVPNDRFSAMRQKEMALQARAEAGALGPAWHGDVYIVMLVLHDQHPEIAVRTIVGSGNEQAVLWKRSAAPVVAVSPRVLQRYADAAYEEVFENGIPGSFHPGTEDEIFAELRAAVVREPF